MFKKFFNKSLDLYKEYLAKLSRIFHIYNKVNKEPVFIEKNLSFIEKVKYTHSIYSDLEEFVFDPHKTSHIFLKDSENIELEMRGKAFLREDSTDPNKKTIFRAATTQEILKANILTIGGIDFDTPRHLSALLKTANKLASYKNDDTQNNYSAIAIFPEVSRQERYEAALKFSQDPTYYPEYIRERVKKYVIEKLLDNTTDKPATLTFFSFSVGGREIMMMENAIKDIARKDFGLSEKELFNLLSYFRGVCLGYAFDPSHIQEMSFKKLIIFSQDDRGVLIPNKLLTSFLLNSMDKTYNIWNLDKKLQISEKSHGNYMIIISSGVVSPSTIEDFEHTIPYYLKAVDILPSEIRGDIAELLTYDEIVIAGESANNEQIL